MLPFYLVQINGCVKSKKERDDFAYETLHFAHVTALYLGTYAWRRSSFDPQIPTSIFKLSVILYSNFLILCRGKCVIHYI
jgi:hypothetical protein